MNQDAALKYPLLNDEVIIVENFLVIKKKVVMSCGDITVLIGEQAAGKSLLAKLWYFFWKYQEDLTNFGSFIFDGIKNLENIDAYNKGKIKFFCDLFPDIETMGGDFSITFKSGDISISVKRKEKSPDIKIDYSEGSKGFRKNAQEAIDSIDRTLDKDLNSQTQIEERRVSLIGRRHRSLSIRVDFSSLPSVLYVSASRSFFATIQDNIFRFVASGEYSLDPLLKQFASFWERYKEYFSNQFKKPEGEESWFKDARKILAGKYVYKNKIDYIKNDWGGMVKLKDASSGQQEVLPLLAAINAFPDEYERNQLLIIEEPEAHIFPLSQGILIKMIAEVVREKGCKVMITTHSPYIPGYVNNEIMRAQNFAVQNKGKSLAISAYHVSKGEVENIYLEKDYLIDADHLDSASEEIMSEYYDELEKSGSSKDDNK